MHSIDCQLGRAARPVTLPLLALILAMLLVVPVAAQRNDDLARLPATYDPDLLTARVVMTKTEFLVGEPIYFDIEFRNDSLQGQNVRFRPYFGEDLQLFVKLPDEEPILYEALNRPTASQGTTNFILPGERRLFHFRVQFSDDPKRPHPTNLFFYEPTTAELTFRFRWTLESGGPQEYISNAIPISIVEPAARNAEALRLIIEPNVLRAIQQEFADPKDFRQIENILALYRDTVYAPHLAYVLANGYLGEAARQQPMNRRLMMEAKKGFEALLQVVEVPYIREVAHHSLARVYLYLGDEPAFVAWYERYLTIYGDEGRFNYANSTTHKYYELAVERQSPAPDEYWYLYP